MVGLHLIVLKLHVNKICAFLDVDKPVETFMIPFHILAIVKLKSSLDVLVLQNLVIGFCRVLLC